MKVAVVSPYRAVVPHFETELDIIQQHLDRGDEVMVLPCTGQLANCEFNPSREVSICRDCCGRRQMGGELLTIGEDPSASLTTHEFFETAPPGDLRLDFDSVAELIAYRWQEFDIGYAALSSLVGHCRDPEPDLGQHAELLRQFLTAAWQVYTQTLRFLQQNPVDRVYAFNGRFAGVRGILRACQRLGVDCFLHERGCDGGHYDLMKNHLPHDLPAIEATIEQRWRDAANDPQRETVAAAWFHDRVNRVEKVWHSFTKDQRRDSLPVDWDATRKNLAIFCSSDDEFVAIGDAWINKLYPNQVEAIEQIVVDLAARQPETRIYLRMHPNLKGVDNARTRRMRNLVGEQLTVIAPEDEVDTYRLIRDSDTVVSFGSSVGSEALFWGTPSVLLGPCFYQNLGGVYRPRSHQQTLDWLCADLVPGDPTGALKYGYWFQTRGVPYRYFESTDLFEGTFKGEVIYDRPPRKKKRLRRWLSRVGFA